MNLNDPIFSDEAKARGYFENLRWPNGPVCPHCGCSERCYRLEGKSHRPGLIHCNDCAGSFTVTTGGVMESSHIPLTKWALGFRLFAASKKGFSAHQLHRMLGISYKSAWFMAHRIREAMKPSGKAATPKGGAGKIVEADETYVGGREKNKHLSKRNKKTKGSMGKEVVFTLVERGGHVRSHHVANVTGDNLREILSAQISPASTVMTDEAGQNRKFGERFARHEMVNHRADEYVRGDAHTNTVEGYFSILKRGVTGTYHHVSAQHLHRYLGEFDFRYNERSALGVDDNQRTAAAVRGAAGKRLTYQQSRSA